MNTFRRFLSPAALQALIAMRAELGDRLQGTTPDEDMTVLASLLVSSGARRVLQFGTFLGGSAVVIGDIINAANVGAQLVSVDPNKQYNATAKRYTDMAGLSKVCEYWDGEDTAPEIVARATGQVWDFIYLDTTHQYAQTARELEVIASLALPQTVVAMHDASRHAQSLDLEQAGGVKRALAEFLDKNKNWEGMTFEQPAFRGLFGIGAMKMKA